MPRTAARPEFPLNGLFPLEKPTGMMCMKMLDRLKPLLANSPMFHEPGSSRAEERKHLGKRKGGLKIGQGGTLDPLANGVLVVGVGKGTKVLGQFLDCSKSYRSTGLLGCATTSYDSDGPVLSTAPYKHVTRELIEGVLDKFRGDIRQVPPIFSALKMDGKPLYEYAREDKPLPRPIPSRACTISELVLESFTPARKPGSTEGHHYRWPDRHLSAEERKTFRRLNELAKQAGVEKVSAADAEEAAMNGEAAGNAAGGSSDALATLDDVTETAVDEDDRPATFTIRMTVSSGTYVRSIVHDIGIAVGSAAHVVELTRIRQGDYVLEDEEKAGEFEQAAASKAEGQADASAAPPSARPDVALSAEEAAMNGDEEAVPADSPLAAITSTPRKGGCVPWAVFERALAEHKPGNKADDGPWVPKEWEREVYARFDPVER